MNNRLITVLGNFTFPAPSSSPSPNNRETRTGSIIKIHLDPNEILKELMPLEETDSVVTDYFFKIQRGHSTTHSNNKNSSTSGFGHYGIQTALLRSFDRYKGHFLFG